MSVMTREEASVSDKWSHQDFTAVAVFFDIHLDFVRSLFNISLVSATVMMAPEWASPKDFDRNFSISFLVCRQNLTGNEGTAKCDRGASLCMMFFLGYSYGFCTV